MKQAAVIGFGCAGYSAALALRQVSPDAVIHIYSDTEEAPYNPMLTTYYVSGKIDEKAMFPLGDLDCAAKTLGAEIFRSSPVARLKAAEREIVLADGSSRKYDEIVIASGASAVIPPVGPLPEKGIFTMRTASDARRLEKALDGSVRSALVVGAQMVGIKVVELLTKRGIQTTLADMAPQMFPASAYETTAAIIAKRLESAGVKLLLGSPLFAVTETEDGLSCLFSSGESVEADIVIFCSGIRPNISFVDKNEIEVGYGIKTDLRMQTSVPHIYAAGDCCETENILGGGTAYIGLWANSAMQGRTAGSNMGGVPAEYPGNLIQNITHYMDTDFISVGDVKAPGERVFWTAPDGSWRIEATLADGKIVALNILDKAALSGPVKNLLLHRAAHPGATMTEAGKLILARESIPADIIRKLGGEQ